MSSSSCASSPNRFTSLPSEIIIGDQTSIRTKVSVEIMAEIEKSTSSNIKSLLVGLKEEIVNCSALASCWKEAEKLIRRGKLCKGKVSDYNTLNEKIVQSKVEDELHIALITYMMETPFYKRFNRKTQELRSVKEVEKYPYKNYYKLLSIAVNRVRGSHVPNRKDFTVYRGVRGPVEVIEGDLISFQQFLATTRSREVAEYFTGDGGTIMVIQGLTMSKSGGEQQGGSKVKTSRGLSNSNFICLDYIPPATGQSLDMECLVLRREAFMVTEVQMADSDNGSGFNSCVGNNKMNYVYLQA